MKLGIFAKTFSGTDPQTVLTAASAAGFAAVQYNMACSGLPAMPDFISSETARAVAAGGSAASVTIAAVSGTYNMIHPDRRERSRGHTRLEVIAAAAAGLSTRLITLCTGTRDPHDQWRAHPANDTPDAWADLLESMHTALAIADRYDVELGIEPELANVVNSADKARRLIDELKSARLKIVFDPANLFKTATPAVRRTVVENAVELLADRIVLAHAKDRTPDGAFTTAGRGVLDYAHYLACLKNVGFDKTLVTHGLTATEAPGVADFLHHALQEAGFPVST